jgi:hypothetical protein
VSAFLLWNGGAPEKTKCGAAQVLKSEYPSCQRDENRVYYAQQREIHAHYAINPGKREPLGGRDLRYSSEWAVSDGDGKEYRYPKEKSVKNFSSFGKKMFDKGLFFC